MTLLFPHIPKTGGTSFLKALKESFGARLLLDYTNNQRNKSAYSLWLQKHRMYFNKKKIKRDYDLIYGHFDPAVYERLDLSAGMFFREPIDRAKSHYSYLLSRNLLAPSMPFTDFLVQPKIQYMYRYYCGRLSVDDLVFVGITERYAESLALFRAIFGVEMPEYNERIGVKKNQHEFNDDAVLLHEDNKKIYESALKRFDYLSNKYL